MTLNSLDRASSCCHRLRHNSSSHPVLDTLDMNSSLFLLRIENQTLGYVPYARDSIWHSFSPCRSCVWLWSKVSRNQLRVSFQKRLPLWSTTYPPMCVKVWVSRMSWPRLHRKLLSASPGGRMQRHRISLLTRSAFTQNVPRPWF